MRKAVLFVLLIMSVLVALVAAAMPATATPALPAQAAACPHVNWGSLPEAAGPMLPSKITGVRVGSHPCYARLVVQTDGTQTPGYDVRYSATVAGRRIYGRDVMLLPPGPGVREGVVIEMLSNEPASASNPVASGGVLEKPLKTFSFG